MELIESDKSLPDLKTHTVTTIFDDMRLIVSQTSERINGLLERPSMNDMDETVFNQKTPIKDLSTFEAIDFLDCLLGCDSREARIRLAEEHYPSIALVEIAGHAGFGQGSLVMAGSCFKDSYDTVGVEPDQMLRFMVGKAMHIASGCDDCSDRFAVFFEENISLP